MPLEKLCLVVNDKMMTFNKIRALRLVVPLAAGALMMGLPAAASAQFTGYYAHPWTFARTNPGSGAFWTGSTSSLTITGHNAGGGGDTATYTIPALLGGLVSFNWSYSSTDTDDYDRGGYIINGFKTVLANNASQGSGSGSFFVNTGDIFGFYVESADGNFGPGILSISNFVAPVPEPATLTVIGLGLAAVARRRRKA
jgi:hypothetical protein